MPTKKRQSVARGGKKVSKGTGFTVEGKSVEQLLKDGSAHLHQYREDNLRAIVNRLASAGNKRLRRAESSGLTDSPAYQAVQASGGKFSSKGKDLEGLKAEFLRLKSYFTDYTSTQQGWKNVKEESERKARQAGALPKRGTHPNAQWTYDEVFGTYSHPDFGVGWMYDASTDSYIDPATGEEVAGKGAPRRYHDFDATQDTRRTATGTETGDIWAMVDSLAKLDPAFSRQVNGYAADVLSLREKLFEAIDIEYVAHPELTLEEVRDLVAQRLNQIKEEYQSFYGEASKIGESEFM